LTGHPDVVVIGAGPAGLATSYELSQAGVEHVVLERGRVGETWRGRWDSFCLVTPNWSVQLPGGSYDGDDPDGFMQRDEIVAFFERYAARADAPIRAGVDVMALRPTDDGFLLETNAGPIRAGSVVVATGAYQRPHRPAAATELPAGLLQLDSTEYRNEGGLPDGAVLVVGSGQTGCQIAEELLEAGREVFLSCGRAPWLPRRIGDHDFVWWAAETGFLDHRVEELPAPAARLAANLLATGRNGGHDLHLRTLRAAGVTLLGRLLDGDGKRARFAPDLGESVAWGDERYRQFRELVRRLVAERGLPSPELPDPDPFDGKAPESVDLAGLGAVVFAGGFRPGYGRWIDLPAAFDDLGFPLHADGMSLVAPGLFFIGVHFLRKRKSSILYGMGEDAAIVANGVAARRHR
jgi:putative flavoprotein involved in K+ transport